MATNPLARKHHYVPQGYLAAFTPTGGKNDLFYVLEINNGRRFRTSPGNVAVQRDFNRVDVEGQSPDAVEKALSAFEGESIAAIRQLKHALGLANQLGEQFSLYYVYLDWPGKESTIHSAEVNQFADQVGKELRLVALTYQELL